MESRLSAADFKQAADPLVIALACTGDVRAFVEIVARRQARVRKFMYHLCRRPSLGDDLAQQVFLTAWRSVKQLRSAAAFDGWLKRIMVTTWLEEVRRQKIAYAAELDAERAGSYRETTAERLDLDAALALLPPEVRLCVVLAYNEGLSHPEIAALRTRILQAAGLVALILSSPTLIDVSVWMSARLDELFALASGWLESPFVLAGAALCALVALATKWARVW